MPLDLKTKGLQKILENLSICGKIILHYFNTFNLIRNYKLIILFGKSLTKDEKQRPKYNVLLQHSLIKFHTSNQISMRDYFERYITEMQSRESNK